MAASVYLGARSPSALPVRPIHTGVREVAEGERSEPEAADRSRHTHTAAPRHIIGRRPYASFPLLKGGGGGRAQRVRVRRPPETYAHSRLRYGQTASGRAPIGRKVAQTPYLTELDVLNVVQYRQGAYWVQGGSNALSHRVRRSKRGAVQAGRLLGAGWLKCLISSS